MADGKKGWVVIGLVGLIALLMITPACSQPTPEPPVTVLVTVVHTQIAEVTVEVTRIIEQIVTATPTSTPEPTPTPEPAVYVEPVTLLELEGAGETVSDNYELPKCWKGVLYWTVEASSSGSASLIVHIHNVQEATEHSIVNEFTMGVDGISESVLVPLKGGGYFFSTENTDQAWSLRLECHDRIAPVSAGLDLQGIGNLVTDNYELHQCQKSVFVWSVEPSERGTASMIARLCKDSATECVSLVNEFDMDLTEPLAGETLQALSGGNYFFAIENTSGRPWNIKWECRD